MPVLTIRWHTHIDERTCLRCGFLDNHTWHFHTAKVQFPDELRHPYWGVIWDCIRDEPRIHGEGSRKGPWHCRCWLTWTLDDADLTARYQSLVTWVTHTYQQLVVF